MDSVAYARSALRQARSAFSFTAVARRRRFCAYALMPIIYASDYSSFFFFRRRSGAQHMLRDVVMPPEESAGACARAARCLH